MNAVAVRWNDWPITRKSLAVVTLPLLLLAVALMAIYTAWSGRTSPPKTTCGRPWKCSAICMKHTHCWPKPPPACAAIGWCGAMNF